MIKTFFANNGSPIKTGAVESQPRNNTSNDQENPQEKRLEGLQGLIQNNNRDTFQSIGPVSLSTISKHLMNPDLVLSSLRGNSLNKIDLSFDVSLGDKSFFDKFDDISTTTKTFSFYENFTGISQDRPEVIMLTDFQPIYSSEKLNSDSFKLKSKPFSPILTDAGHFFEYQLNIRQLKSHNIKHITSFNQKKSSKFNSILLERKTAFANAVNDSNVISTFLSKVIEINEALKNQLDVRDKVHTVNPHSVFRNFLIEQSQISSEETLNFLTTALHQNFNENYDVSFVLEKFGFVRENIRNTFSSTKIWLQLLLEMKDILKSHSLSLFDIRSTQHSNDNNPTKLLKTPGIKRFELKSPSSNPKSLNSILRLSESELAETIQNITISYNEIYENIHFKNEEIRISALVNALTKELKYSAALSEPDVQNTLNSYFNSNTNNQNLFDVVIGQFGDNVSDIPNSNVSNNSLASLYQRKENNIIILPFESRPLEADTGTLKSGAEVYVDSIVDTNGNIFNTRKIKEFYDILLSSERSFNIIVNKLNFLSLTSTNDSAYNDSRQKSKLDNQIAFFDDIVNDLIGGNNSLLDDDVSSSLFAMARFDEKLRTLLFLYTIIDDEATKVTLKNEINLVAREKLSDVTLSELIERSRKDSTISISFSRNINLDNSKLVSTIRQKFTEIPFLKKSLARYTNNRNENVQFTNYGKHIDTVIAMVFFDILLAVISNYTNNKLVGMTIVDGQQKFAIQKSSILTKDNKNTKSSIEEIHARINKEISLTQHMTFIVLNSLKRLRTTVNNVINFVESESSLTQLRKISNIMGNDSNLVNLLFDRQQSELIASNVADLNFKLKNVGDNQGDEIKILDEFVVGPNLKNGLEGIFSSQQFASNNAKNQKILSIGIPLGFSSNLKRKIDTVRIKKLSQSDRSQNDLINIKLYKVDIQNPDIIFLPKEFLFELSRYPTRNDDLIKTTTSSQSKNILDVIKTFPTRDYSEIFSPTGVQVQYLQAQNNETQALSTKEYDFLSDKNKRQLYSNHVISYALECYLKIMTGISTADHNFNLTYLPSKFDSQFTETFLKFHLNNFNEKNQVPSTQNRPMLFNKIPTNALRNASGYSTIESLSHYENNTKKATADPVSLNTSISTISSKDIPTISHQLSVLNEVFRTLTDISDPDWILKNIISPKQFDRVFNVIFDPYDFKIDVNATNSTPHGKVAFQTMINCGEIMKESVPSKSSLVYHSPKQGYVYRSRNKSEGDLLMEKYFVVIETFDQEEN
jgi:hypothetical protein